MARISCAVSGFSSRPAMLAILARWFELTTANAINSKTGNIATT